MIARSGFWKRTANIKTNLPRVLSRPVGNSSLKLSRLFSNSNNSKPSTHTNLTQNSGQTDSSQPQLAKSHLDQKLTPFPEIPEEIPENPDPTLSPTAHKLYVFSSYKLLQASQKTVNLYYWIHKSKYIYFAGIVGIFGSEYLLFQYRPELHKYLFPNFILNIVFFASSYKMVMWSTTIGDKVITKAELFEDMTKVKIHWGFQQSKSAIFYIHELQGQLSMNKEGKLQILLQLPNPNPGPGQPEVIELFYSTPQVADIKDELFVPEELIVDVLTGKVEEVKKYTYVPK